MEADNTTRFSDRPISRVFAQTRLNEKGFTMLSPHCHPYFELFYVGGGACSFFIENNVFELGEGDFMLILPGVFHYTRYTKSSCLRSNIFFRMDDIDEKVAAVMPEGANFFDDTRIFQAPEAFGEQFNGLIARMVREQRIDDVRSGIMERVLLQELFLLCSRECRFLDGLPEQIHTTDSPIVRAAQFITDHYADDITIPDIAAAAGYSPNYLSRKFREAAGVGLHEYLSFIRLQRAALELVSTDDTITDIALRCGFSDGNYFKDAFKKKYGVTPREYRK